MIQYLAYCSIRFGLYHSRAGERVRAEQSSRFPSPGPGQEAQQIFSLDSRDHDSRHTDIAITAGQFQPSDVDTTDSQFNNQPFQLEYDQSENNNFELLLSSNDYQDGFNFNPVELYVDDDILEEEPSGQERVTDYRDYSDYGSDYYDSQRQPDYPDSRRQSDFHDSQRQPDYQEGFGHDDLFYQPKQEDKREYLFEADFDKFYATGGEGGGGGQTGEGAGRREGGPSTQFRDIWADSGADQPSPQQQVNFGF